MNIQEKELPDKDLVMPSSIINISLRNSLGNGVGANSETWTVFFTWRMQVNFSRSTHKNCFGAEINRIFPSPIWPQ